MRGSVRGHTIPKSSPKQRLWPCCFFSALLLSRKVLSVVLEGMQKSVLHHLGTSAYSSAWNSLARFPTFVWNHFNSLLHHPKRAKSFLVLSKGVAACALQSQCCVWSSCPSSAILLSWCLSNWAVRKDLSHIASTSFISACQVGAAAFKHAGDNHLSKTMGGKDGSS